MKPRPVMLLFLWLAVPCWPAAAAWTLYPIASNNAEITTAHIQELIDAVDERCRVTMVPSITNSTCNWTEPNGVSNYYLITPPRITYTMNLSTGLYVSGYTTQSVVEAGVTNVYVFTNYVLGVRSITCTNLLCTYTNLDGSSVSITNRYYTHSGILEHLDNKIGLLLDYYHAPALVGTTSVASAYFNDFYAANPLTNTPFRRGSFPPMSETNWGTQTGAGADDIYANLEGGVAIRTKYSALLTVPENAFSNVLLGELHFVSTNSYVVTNGSNLLTFRDISLRYVDRGAIDIQWTRLTEWSNRVNPIRWAMYTDSNTYPSPPPVSFTIGGKERFWNNGTTSPVISNFTASIQFAGDGTLSGIGNKNMYDCTNLTSTFFTSQDIDGNYPKWEGQVIQIYWTEPVAYYAIRPPGVSFTRSTFAQPGLLTIENLNARYLLLDAMRYSRVVGPGGSDPGLIYSSRDLQWLSSQESTTNGGEWALTCEDAKSGTSVATQEQPPLTNQTGSAWGYYSRITLYDLDGDPGDPRYYASREYANSQWKIPEVSYSLTGQVGHGWATWTETSSEADHPTYTVEYMGQTASGAGISSTQLVSVAKFGPTSMPDWPGCTNSYSKDQWRTYNPYYIDWAFDKASWTP